MTKVGVIMFKGFSFFPHIKTNNDRYLGVCVIVWQEDYSRLNTRTILGIFFVDTRKNRYVESKTIVHWRGKINNDKQS